MNSNEFSQRIFQDYDRNQGLYWRFLALVVLTDGELYSDYVASFIIEMERNRNAYDTNVSTSKIDEFIARHPNEYSQLVGGVHEICSYSADKAFNIVNDFMINYNEKRNEKESEEQEPVNEEEVDPVKEEETEPEVYAGNQNASETVVNPVNTYSSATPSRSESKKDELKSSDETAIDFIDNEIKKTDEAITNQEKKINDYDGFAPRKEFYKLERLKSYREKLFEKRDEIESSKVINSNFDGLDENLSNVNNNISLTNEELKNETRKLFKSVKNSKLNHLKKKQGRIKNIQTKLVNKELSKYYKKAKKEVRFDETNKEAGLESFYDNKEELFTERLNDLDSKIIEDVDDNLIIGSVQQVKNLLYTVRKKPIELRLKLLEKMRDVDLVYHGAVREVKEGVSDTIVDSIPAAFISKQIEKLKGFKDNIEFSIINTVTNENEMEETVRVRS